MYLTRNSHNAAHVCEQTQRTPRSSWDPQDVPMSDRSGLKFLRLRGHNLKWREIKCTRKNCVQTPNQDEPGTKSVKLPSMSCGTHVNSRPFFTQRKQNKCSQAHLSRGGDGARVRRVERNRIPAPNDLQLHCERSNIFWREISCLCCSEIHVSQPT